MKGFVVKGTKVLVANLDGNFFAIGSVCTHVGGPLDKGTLEGDVVTCPWHRSKFNVESGAVIAGPAAKPEPSYKVEVDGKDLLMVL